jgi:hypothetical protein
MAFELSGGLNGIMRRLHEASRTEEPWLAGKRLLADCGYQSNWLGDVFKRHRNPSWRELIQGNGKGSFRLNLQPLNQNKRPS